MDSEQKEIDRNLGILAKSSIIVFVGVFLSKLFTYLYRIIIARYYGPEVYGLFSLTLIIIGIFMAFSSFGLSGGLLRFIPIYRAKGQEEKISYLIKISQRILLVSGIFSVIILWILSDFIATNIFHDPELILFLRIFALAVPISLFSGMYFALIRSYEKIKAYSFGVNILQNASKLIMVIIFIFMGMKFAEVVSLSYILALFLGLVFAYLYSRIKLSKKFTEKAHISKLEKRGLLRKVLRYSWPLVLVGIIGSIMLWIDTILIGYFQDSYWVGIYNAAIPIAILLGMSQEIFIQMFFPMITREMYAKKLKTVKELSKQVTKWIFIINLPGLALILLFPGVFITFFFGSEYLLASNALRLLALGYFVYYTSTISSNLLLSRGKSKLILVNIVIASMANFLLNYFLIPVYGINGAAFSTFISLVILAFLLTIESYYINKIFPFRRKLINVVISVAIPALLLFWISEILDPSLILTIMFGIIFVFAYLMLILLTKAFDENDLKIIKKIKEKL